MKEPSVVHATSVIERSYPQPPDAVFSAFSDEAVKRRWYAEGRSHELEEFQMDFRPGGIERVCYRFKEGTPFPGVALINEGSYQDIVPGTRIVIASTMTIGDRRISASLVTFELLAADSGTDLICTHQDAFFEGSDGPESREAGWRKLLDRLEAELARP